MNELRAAYIYQAYRGNNAMDFHTCVNEIIATGKSESYLEGCTFPYHHKDHLTYADAVYVANMIKNADANGVNLPTYFFDRLPIRLKSQREGD